MSITKTDTDEAAYSGLNSAEKRSRRIVIQTTVPITLRCFFKGQLAWLRRRGFEVHAVSSPGPELERIAHDEGVEIHAVPMTRSISPTADLVALIRLVQLYWRLRPQVVHGFTPKGGLLAMLAAWLARVPVRVYTIFGFVHTARSGVARWLMLWTERISCTLAHTVICECESIRDIAITDRVCSAGKLKVIPAWSLNSVAEIQQRNQEKARHKADVRARLGIGPDALVVGFIGRIVADKGVAEIVEAHGALSSEYPDLHLLLIGELEQHNRLSSSVLSRLMSNPHVHLTGFTEDVVPYLSCMDVLAHPSYREGLPTAPLEGAAIGLPVVASSIPGCVDAVRDGITGILVPPRDSEALTVALRALVKDHQMRKRMGTAAGAWIKEHVVSSWWESLSAEYRVLLAGKQPLSPASDFYTLYGKRVMDVLGALLAIIVSAPLTLIAAATVRLVLGRPVLISQKRPGKGGALFTLYKFRTMTDERDEHSRLLPDECRLTKMGNVLRSLSLDELPELFNVIRGEMSLVGPRPLLPEYLPRYNAFQRRRHEVKSGMTGWVQVNGRNALTWEQKFELDVWYVEHASLLLDLRILWLTLLGVLRCQGIQHDGYATMPKFLGSPQDTTKS